MFDIYSKETVKEMCKLSHRGYFKSLINMDEIPTENCMYLLLAKIKECETAATQRILDEATKRREALNDSMLS